MIGEVGLGGPGPGHAAVGGKIGPGIMNQFLEEAGRSIGQLPVADNPLLVEQPFDFGSNPLDFGQILFYSRLICSGCASEDLAKQPSKQ